MSAVVKAVKSVVNTVVKVVKKVVTTVVDTVKAAVKDPVTTIAKIAAYATGNAWAIPLIDGASTLAKGGSIGDAIKVAAISYGTGKLAVKIGTPVGNAAGNFAASQFSAEAATQKLVTDIVTRATGNAAVAVITKQDPVKAFIAGGVTAASSAVLGKIPGFDKQPAWVQNTVASSVGAYVAGQQKFDEAAAASIVATSGIVSDALKAFDPDGTKLTAGQRAVAADAIFKTTSAALAGRSPTEALAKSLTDGAMAALGEFAKDTIKTATEGMAEGYARIKGYGEQLDTIATKSKAATDKFNDVNGSLQAAINEQNRLYKVQQDARTAYDKNVSDANYKAAEDAVKAYNDYTTALNKSYGEYYKPTLDALSKEVSGYQAEYDKITGLTSSENEKLRGQIDGLTKSLDPVYLNSNRAFAERLMPGFDPTAYRALNPNIPKDADPYLHYITTGQHDGLKGTQAQLKESTDIVNAILTNPNVDERALQEYVKSGYVTEAFVASVTKKNYNDLVNELDKRVTTEDEAKDFFKEVYGRDVETPADMETVQRFVSMAETAATHGLQVQKQMADDDATFVFNATEAKSQAEAIEQARAQGYNTVRYNGQTFSFVSKEVQDKRTELATQVLEASGKNLVTATAEDIDRAVELVRNVPQEKLMGGISAQDVINGNYTGWRDGKYYVYRGGELHERYVLNPKTGKADLEYVLVELDSPNTLPTIVVTGQRDLSDLAEADPNSMYDIAKKLDEESKNALGDYLTKAMNTAMLAAESTGNKELANNIRQTASIVTQGLGEQTENLAKFFASVTGGSYDTSLIRAAKAMQTWGAANQSANTKEQEAAIKNAVSKAEGVTGKIGAFLTAVKDNPSGFFTMVAKEGVQEVLPLWAARGVMTFGKIAAYGANAALEGMESWGSSSGQVYNDALKSGKNEYEARDMALKAGFQSAVITAVTTGVTDIPMVKKVLGDGVVSSYKDIGKATAASTMGEYVEELFQNANNQRITTGKIDWDYATTAATLAAGTAAGTTGSIMTGLNIRETAFVAKDANGNDVTLSDFLAGTKQVDMKTLNMNTVVGTSADGDNITLGGVAAMQMASGVSYDTFKTAMPAVIANQDFVLGTNALGDQVTLSQAMSQVTSNQGFDTVYNNLLNTTAEQRVQAQTDYLKTTLESAGYKPSEAEIKSLVQSTPPGSNALAAAAQQYADTHTVTEAEATKALKEAYTAAGFKDYTPTKEQVDAYVQSGANINQAAVIENIKTYVNENSVTYDEAKKMLTDRGYNPTDAEIKQFVATVNQNTQLEAVTQYVDPRQVTFDEAKKYLTDLGYKPTDEEVQQFVGQKNDAAYQATQTTAVGTYVDPRLVDEQEVRDAYTALGLKKPTMEDVQKLMGQYAETDLAGKAKENLDPARYNSIMFELENMAKQAGVSPEALEAIKTDFNTQFKALGVDIDKLSGQVGQVQTDIADTRTALTAAIADAKAAGLEGDAALQKAIDTVAADLGTSKEALLTQLGTTEANLKTEFATQIGEVQTQIADVQKSVLDRMAEYEAAGLARDDALSTAISDVASDLGKTREDIMGQIGAPSSVDAEGKPVAATGVYAALETGLSGVKADIGDVKTDIGGVKTDVANLSADLQTKYDTLTDNQKALADQLTQAGVDFRTAMDIARTETSEGFKNVFDTLAANKASTDEAIAQSSASSQAAIAREAEVTRQAQAAEAERTRQAAARNAANQARLGNLNTMMSMLGQSGDVGGQQVTVKAADPAKIGYIYDWSSIFANPSQEKMFASPYGGYAKGGVVGDDLDAVNEELLKLLRG